MDVWSLGGQLLYCCQLCLPWFIHDYLRDDAHDYVNLAKYIVSSPSEHERLVDKEPRRNTEQYFWKVIKPIIKRRDSKGPQYTPDLVQWIHKEELLRRDEEPRERCWETPWKCVVIFSKHNRYGKVHYTLVDVCTLEHIDGKEGLAIGWKSHVINVIKKYRPLRIYVVNKSPFDVSNREYYAMFTISGFVEIYLRPEGVLVNKLLFEVWPRYLIKVSYILSHLSTVEYTSLKNKYVNFNTDLNLAEDNEIILPKKIKFLEPYENKIEDSIKKDLKAYKKLILKRELRKRESLLIEENINEADLITIPRENSGIQTSMYHSPSMQSQSLLELNPYRTLLRNKYKRESKINLQSIKALLTAVKHIETRQTTIATVQSEIINDKREFCEYLWRRERYLSEEEQIHKYFPGAMVYDSLVSNKTHYMIDTKKENIGLYLGYLNDWKECAPSLIFDNSGKLYGNPAREIIKFRRKRKDLAKTMREGHRKKSYHRAEQVKKISTFSRWNTFWTGKLLGLHVDKVTKEYCETRRWYKTHKGWTDRDWVGRAVDRRQYTTGFEWFKDKYPNVYAGAAKRRELKDWLYKEDRSRWHEFELPTEEDARISVYSN